MSRRLLVSTFAHEQDLLDATNTAREKGYTILDSFTPFAVHGLDKAMGMRPTRLAWVTFFLGISGAIAKLWFQIWTSATSWPVNVGGKPLKSVPAFVPVTFEVMVLFAGVGSVLFFLFRRKLWPGKKPRFVYERTTNDRFVLVLVEDRADFDVSEVRQLFAPFHLVNLEERMEQES
jgi:hypothetical protein